MSIVDEMVAKYDAILERLERLEVQERPRFAARVSVYKDSDTSHTTSGDWETINFNQERWDTHAFHSTVSNTGRLTVPTGQDGLYIIIGMVRFAANATGVRGLNFLLNDTTNIGRKIIPNGGASDGVNVVLPRLYVLAATNYVKLQAYQNSGGALNMVYSAQISPEFMMARIA